MHSPARIHIQTKWRCQFLQRHANRNDGEGSAAENLYVILQICWSSPNAAAEGEISSRSDVQENRNEKRLKNGGRYENGFWTPTRRDEQQTEGFWRNSSKWLRDEGKSVERNGSQEISGSKGEPGGGKGGGNMLARHASQLWRHYTGKGVQDNSGLRYQWPRGASCQNGAQKNGVKRDCNSSGGRPSGWQQWWYRRC